MTSYDEKFTARVFDSFSDSLAVYDPSFRVLRVNQALTQLFGFSVQQIIGKYCYKVFYNRTQNCDECHVDEVFRTGEKQVLEKRVTTADGSEHIFEVHSYPIKDINGKTIQAVEHFRDITERKNLEHKLQASKEFNENIINNITDSLSVIDPKTHTIVQANETFHSRVGLEPPNAVGRRCHEIIRGSLKPCGTAGFHCPLGETIRTGLSALSDKSYLNSGGENRMLAIATYPILDDQGKVDLVIRFERDVTEKRRMEEALAFRSKELQRTQHQLETLFEFSRQISTKKSPAEVINFLYDLAQKIFSNSEFLPFLLDGDSHQFLDLKECNLNVVEPLSRVLQKLEQSGLVNDFVQYLQKNMGHRIIGSGQTEDIPNFLKAISESYPSWFGLPVSTPQQCIGYFVLASSAFREYPREDIHFFMTLFNQIAGYIRHLVIYETEIDLLQQRVAERTSYGKIIGRSDPMQKIYELIDLVAGSDVNVLITGENGTGKELVAQAIHHQSPRKNGPFVVANCSAYSPALLESELFGHEKGAFTGAIKMKKGRIERAQGGILFLDEIGDIAPATQVLLLRFLQDHCFERVGGEETLEADVRVLAATNRDLSREAEAGRFRDDLYYRLNVITLELPPLRDRKEDIPSLCSHFLEKYSLKEGKKINSFSPDAMQALMDCEWPGNVRQLENAVSHASILTQSRIIERRHLPQFLKQSVSEPSTTCLAENERKLILGVLQESNWNKHEAARRLEISRSTLYSKIRRYHLEKGARPV